MSIGHQPPDPHSWGEIRELGDTPKPSAGTCPLHPFETDLPDSRQDVSCTAAVEIEPKLP
jgi:hypothetical protein